MYSLEQELNGQDIEYIKNKLDENVRVIDAGLESYLDISSGDYADLIEAMRYSALSGGKRIRGFLTRECFEIFNGYRDDELILPVACAIEIIHAYSLIHDDLPCMDDDDMRRGQPANHIKFGEAAAILAGDALLAFAFSILADAEKISPEIKIKIISEISRAAGYSGMVGGQMMDLNYADNADNIDVVRLIKLHTLKTGALIIAAARAGCIAGGANEAELVLISEYAKNIGLAFQVIDDSFDGDGFVDILGNTGDTVEYARKLTLEALLKLEKLKEINTRINVKSLEIAAKYLLYREY
jgi:geranylgeranyl pyrophosphate synthase